MMMMEFLGDGKLPEQMIGSVFVYGTLKRGQCREQMWPVAAMAIRDAWVRGTLFSRDDYPAMLAGNDRILGECWDFPAEAIGEVLHCLDEIECTNQPGQDDLYHRVCLDVFDLAGRPLRKAYAFHYAHDPLQDDFIRVIPVSAEAYVAWPETPSA